MKRDGGRETAGAITVRFASSLWLPVLSARERALTTPDSG